MLDSELNDLTESLNQTIDVINGVTSSSGQLRNQSVATAQALVGAQRFVATASQTIFTTTIAWQASFTALNVEVFSQGAKLDSSLVTAADSAGFLRVTIPAQAVSDVVFVAAFESGAGLITRMANTASASDGANMIGIQDVGALIAATTVEGALAETRTALNSLITSLGSIATFWKRDGTNAATANIPLGGFKLTGVADGTASTDAVNLQQLAAVNQSLSTLSGAFLRKDGLNAMTGQLDFGSLKAKNLATPTLSNDAANKGYVDGLLVAASPIGCIIGFAGTIAPTGWAMCDGTQVSRTLPATLALYNVIGIAYGAGDGTTTYHLPNLQGRTLVGRGTSNGGGVAGSGAISGGVALTNRNNGQWGGAETHTLTVSQIPAHVHSVYGVGYDGSSGPSADIGGSADQQDSFPTGGGAAHENMSPFVTSNFIIKL